MNRRNTSWKRLCASCGGSSGTGGCSPMMSFNSGTRSTMSCPFGPSASRRASRQLGQLGFALAQKRADQALKGLSQGRIGDVALVLVELARGEEPARRHQHFVQLIDDGGLADAGISGDQHQLRRAAVDDAVEGGEQGLDLARSPVQLLGDQQPVRRVVFAERERRRCGRSRSHSARQRRRSRSTPAAVW